MVSTMSKMFDRQDRRFSIKYSRGEKVEFWLILFTVFLCGGFPTSWGKEK